MRSFLLIIIVSLLFSCSKEEIGPQCVSCIEEETDTQLADVLIVNEGNFGWNNGSIFLYKPLVQTISQNIFSQTNNVPLGDVIQSITQFNNKAYIVVNNSNKVEVVDLNSFNTLATITGFNSPRYFLPINNQKAYVTDLYANSIQVVNLNSNSITSNIPLSGWTEELLLHNDSVYVCDVTNDNLLIINQAKNKGSFGSYTGTFDFEIDKKDPFAISATGFKVERFDSVGTSFDLTIYLKPLTFQSKTVTVAALKTLDELKKERSKLEKRETKTVTGIDALSSPITALYEAFSKRAKSKWKNIKGSKGWNNFAADRRKF